MLPYGYGCWPNAADAATMVSDDNPIPIGCKTASVFAGPPDELPTKCVYSWLSLVADIPVNERSMVGTPAFPTSRPPLSASSSYARPIR